MKHFVLLAVIFAAFVSACCKPEIEGENGFENTQNKRSDVEKSDKKRWTWVVMYL